MYNQYMRWVLKTEMSFENRNEIFHKHLASHGKCFRPDCTIAITSRMRLDLDVRLRSYMSTCICCWQNYWSGSCRICRTCFTSPETRFVSRFRAGGKRDSYRVSGLAETRFVSELVRYAFQGWRDWFQGWQKRNSYRVSALKLVWRSRPFPS